MFDTQQLNEAQLGVGSALPAGALQQLNETLQHGSVLSEKRYNKYFSEECGLGIKDPIRRSITALVMENTERWYRGLSESNQMLHVGNFKNHMFSLIRGVIPELAAMDLVSVQPISLPQGFIFYLDYVYGISKGRAVSGQRLSPETDAYYSSPLVREEVIGTGNAAIVNFVQFSQFAPIIPGSVSINDGTETFTDDGAGVLTGSAGGTGTINYDTGQIDVVFNAAPGAGDLVVTDYEYQQEANENMGSVDIQFSSAPVTARTRKLKARWTLEGAASAAGQFNLDLEAELLSTITKLIRAEVNFEIVEKLFRVASAATTLTWDRTPPDPSIPWDIHKRTIKDAFVVGSNNIHKATGVATGNWIVAGNNVSNVVETLPDFIPDSDYPVLAPNSAQTRGLFRMGVLANRWVIYKDPSINENDFLIGHKGDSLVDTGFIYAPWLPVYTIPSYMLADMIGTKVLGTAYATKVINPRMYQRGRMVALGSGGRSY